MTVIYIYMYDYTVCVGKYIINHNWGKYSHRSTNGKTFLR